MSPKGNKSESESGVLLHAQKRELDFKAGQDLFNNEKFFEAHEVWEQLWKTESGDNKLFVQALIQVAGFFVHIQKQNWSGAQSLASLAKQKFSNIQKMDSFYAQFDIDSVLWAVNYNMDYIWKHFLSPDQSEVNPGEHSFLFPRLLDK